MLDLHCHIIPEIDDGPKTMHEALDMARAAVNEGITHILATPHHMNRHWMNEKGKVVRLVSELQEELKSRDVPLTIFPGQEVRLYGEILEDIQQDKILFTDEGEHYVLLEFPTRNIPTYTEQLFYELEMKGYTPVIVHPERNREILEHPNRLKNLIDKGALSQLTAASYIGKFGKPIQKLSKQLIEANLVHFIASDAHNTTNRTFHMKEAYERLEKDYGKEKRNQFHQVTRDLLNGDVIVPNTPRSITKKKFFGLF